MYRKNRHSIILSEDDDDKVLEVTEWSNGAGVDFSIEHRGTRVTYPLSYKDVRILKKLVKELLKNVD
jgi:hypothetical protein